MSRTILIFLPEAGMYPYLRTLSLLADSFNKENNKIYIVNCDNFLPRCIMDNCFHSPKDFSKEQRQSICKKCKENLDAVKKNYGFDSINLRDYLAEEKKLFIEKLLEISPAEWQSIEYDGCKVGQIAIHDLMIETKVLSTENLTEGQLFIYRNYIRTMCYIISCMDEIIKQLNLDICMTFNPYCQNQAVLYSCKKNKIIYKSITGITHLGSNYSCFTVSDSTFTRENRDNVQSFDNTIPVSSKNVWRNYQDSLFRMFQSGSHIFSAQKKDKPNDTLRKLKLNSDKKIVVAFTGSYDERLGIDIYLKAWKTPLNEQEIFESQIEWLKYLCEIAKEDKSIQFIFRIHPREGRDGGSMHLKILRETFNNIPTNVQIIWPETPISSYDLLEIMDLCLISTSTMGLECNRVGISAMSYTRNLNYPNEGYIPIPKTKEEYKDKFYELLNKKVTINDFVLASRFYNWKTFISCIDMECYIQKSFADKNYWPRCPKTKRMLVKDVLEDKVNIFEYNKKVIINANFPAEEERIANYQGIKLLILYFMLGYKLPDFKIFFHKCLSVFFRIRRKIFKNDFTEQNYDEMYFFMTLKKREKFSLMFVNNINLIYFIGSMFGKCYFYMENTIIKLIYKGRIYSRYSPLLYKLCLLYRNFKV